MEKWTWIVDWLQKKISSPYGGIAILILGMGFYIYRQENLLEECNADKRLLEERSRTAYADGQDDAIKKVGEQIKVIQSMGVIINQSIEQQKQNNNESKKLNKQLDNLKHELQ